METKQKKHIAAVSGHPIVFRLFVVSGDFTILQMMQLCNWLVFPIDQENPNWDVRLEVAN